MANESPLLMKIVIKPIPPYLNEYTQKEAMRVIAELRAKHSNYVAIPLVDVLVAVCEDCASHEGLSRIPDIVTEDWQTDLRNCGLTVKQIAQIKRIVKNNPHASVTAIVSVVENFAMVETISTLKEFRSENTSMN
jgi:hypothetical protein